MKRELWVERILTGASAMAGPMVFAAFIFAGIAVLIWIEKAPEFLAIVIAAGMVSAALYFRKPDRIYNLTVGHPETGEIIEALHRLLDNGERK